MDFSDISIGMNLRLGIGIWYRYEFWVSVSGIGIGLNFGYRYRYRYRYRYGSSTGYRYRYRYRWNTRWVSGGWLVVMIRIEAHSSRQTTGIVLARTCHSQLHLILKGPKLLLPWRVVGWWGVIIRIRANLSSAELAN